ncbi:MAG: shikimate dehydrogenase [Nocardioides sp.]
MRCAVLGDPIDHSLSPVLHRAGYDALGLDWSYDAVRVPSGGLARFFAEGGRWRGLSLTMPLKREVLAFGDEVTERARTAGAANTVVFDDGRLLLDNTDRPGAVAAVSERFTGQVTEVSILGAGATAASLGLALCDLGARTVRVFSREQGRAAQTIGAVLAHESGPEVIWADLARVGAGTRLDGSVIVSTIPAEAQGKALVAACGEVPVIFEALYDPWPTPLAATALSSGQVLVSGLDLLVHQAALQFTLFTARAAPLVQMRAAGLAALQARSQR